jgi:hypothetical protein
MSLPSRLVRSIASRSASLLARSTAAVPQQSRLCLSTLTGGAQLAQLAKENPYKDVVRYEHKNRKWNLQHVDFYSEALAIGLLENGLQPGDVVLSWLPAHFSESVSILSHSVFFELYCIVFVLYCIVFVLYLYLCCSF